MLCRERDDTQVHIQQGHFVALAVSEGGRSQDAHIMVAPGRLMALLINGLGRPLEAPAW